MRKEVDFFCENNQKSYTIEKGSSLLEISKGIPHELKHRPVGAFVNNSLQEMSYELYKPKHVSFIDITHADGMRMYTRSLQFVLIKACESLYPDWSISIKHSISKGIYCEFQEIENAPIDTILRLGNKMR